MLLPVETITLGLYFFHNFLLVNSILKYTPKNDHLLPESSSFNSFLLEDSPSIISIAPISSNAGICFVARTLSVTSTVSYLPNKSCKAIIWEKCPPWLQANITVLLSLLIIIVFL